MRAINLLFAAFGALSPSVSAARNKPANAVLLSTVKSLTLKDGALTSARRVDPVAQLSLTGGNAKGLYKVDAMRCTNSGSSYDTEDVEWRCDAQLPPEFKLGSTDVICEGYDSSDDPYILKGSCGVEYRLILTEYGEEKYGRPGSGKFYKDDSDGPDNVLFTLLFWLIFLGIAFFMLYKFFKLFGGAARDPGFVGALADGFNGGGGGGGGGDDSNNDPPPPYTPHVPPKPKTYTAPNTNTYTTSRTSSAQSSRTTREEQRWRPGFWTGTATGAAAGYAANSFVNRNRQPSPPRTQAGPSNWFGTDARREPSPPPRAGGSSWLGGLGGGDSSSSSRPTYGGGSSSSSMTPSSTRYSSSGFGGTKRR